MATSLLLPGPATAQSEEGNFCVRDYTPGAVCKAGDVRIEELKQINVIETCDAGTPGFATIEFEMLVSADGSPDRYDVGAFIALDGGSALSGNNCFHDFLNPPLTTTPVFGDANTDAVPDIKNGPWPNLEAADDPGDTCGDIVGGTQNIKTLKPGVGLVVACNDSNFDGSVDISVCSSWDNNKGETCTDVTTAFPGTNSKCGCQVLELNIPPGAPPDEPAIAVSKTPQDQAVLSGANANFTIAVSNTGTEPLDIQFPVTDPECADSPPSYQSGDTGDDGILGVGETWILTCSKFNVTADFTNNVTVCADPDEGDPVCDSDSANVVVVAPAIQVDKNPPSQGVSSGQSATFTIVVQNTGNVDLSNVIIGDLPGCDSFSGPSGDDGDDILETNEIWSYSCTVDNVTADFTNTATATATAAAPGGEVSDEGSANVIVRPSVLEIPALSGWGLGVFAALLAAAALGILVVLRAKSSG